jgi:hypothetical protein
MMRINKSALLAVVLSTALIAVSALDCAWAKDGSSGSGSSGSGSSGSGSSGSSDSGGGSNSGKGGEGKGDQDTASTNSIGSVLNLRSFRTDFGRGGTRSTKRKMPRGGNKLTGSIRELQADLTRAQRALHEAELHFNRGLADPNANLRKLEQAIRNAEMAITAAGARLARASSGQ